MKYHLKGNQYKHNFGRKKIKIIIMLFLGGYIGKRDDLIVDIIKIPTILLVFLMGKVDL